MTCDVFATTKTSFKGTYRYGTARNTGTPVFLEKARAVYAAVCINYPLVFDGSNGVTIMDLQAKP